MSQEKIKQLFQWIKKNKGFIHPNIELNENKKLKVTNKMSAKGVQLFSIPTKLCLDSGNYKNFIQNSDMKFTDIEKEIMSHKFFKLILNIIDQKLKGKTSFHYPLMSSLPQMEELLQKNPIFFYT